VSAIELIANSGQLSAFEFGHTQTAPAFGCSDQSGIHQLEHGALAESVRDDLGASPLLAEQPLEQVGGADRTPVGEGEAEMSNACFEVVLQARQRRPDLGDRLDHLACCL
jgi:hypothetical protein